MRHRADGKRSPGRRGAVVALVGLGIAVAVAGCRRGPVEEPSFTVSGRIVDGGKPLPLDPALAQARAASVNLRFLRLGAGDTPDHSTTGFADATGAFTVPKVRAGRYRIAVIHLNGRQPGDQLGGRFDERKSKIIREFTGETKDLLIDLAQPEVEKPAGS